MEDRGGLIRSKALNEMLRERDQLLNRLDDLDGRILREIDLLRAQIKERPLETAALLGENPNGLSCAQAVLFVLRNTETPLRGREIADVLTAKNLHFRTGTLHVTLHRLVATGDIEKTDVMRDSGYRLASSKTTVDTGTSGP